MIRKTKIVCTLGPAVDDENILRQMMLEGMNIARFNMSHGSHEEHGRRLEMLKKVRKELPPEVLNLFGLFLAFQDVFHVHADYQ